MACQSDPTCGSGCYTVCGANCYDTCVNGCYGGCKGNCVDGCYASCFDSCFNSCVEQCANGCGTECAVACMGVCSTAEYVAAYTTLKNVAFSDPISAAEMTALRDIIATDLIKRGIAPASTSFSAGTLAAVSAVYVLNNNLKMINSSYGVASFSTSIKRDEINTLKAQALSAYES